MNVKKYFLVGLVSMVLLVSVFSAAIAFSAGGTEDEISILVHKGAGAPGSGYFRSDPGYELVEDYDSFMLIETSEENAAFLHEQGYVVERLTDRDHVALHSYSFNTGDGEPELPEGLEIESYRGDPGYHIVQFIGPIMEEWREGLESRGVVIHDYRHRYNYIVEMDAETKREVEDLDFVNWVGIYQPAYRFDRELSERSEDVQVRASFFDGFDLDLAVGDIITLELDENIKYIGENSIALELEPDRIDDLAGIHGVNTITEVHDDYQFFNADATWVAQTNEPDNRKVTDMGLTGEGQLIAVCDSELNIEHEAFYDPDHPGGPHEPFKENEDHRKIHSFYIPDGSDGAVLGDGVYHGTHVTGSVLGESPPHGEYSNHDGNALEARVIFQDVGDEGGGLALPADPAMWYDSLFGDAYDQGARVHTNSWGARGEGQYDESSAVSDEFMWDHKDMNILFAAGNSGPEGDSMAPQASAKNVISAGASENAPSQDNVASFSSRGYAEDGRIKPTILHVGAGLNSAGSRGDDDDPRGGAPYDIEGENNIPELLQGDSFRQDDGYESMDGTSMSCPGLAGQAGQIRHYYEGGWYPSGSPSPGDEFNPSGALVRATMINGAVEMTGSGAYENDNRFPNNDQGFGRSMLDRVLHFEGDNRNLIAYDSWDEGLELGTGQSYDMQFEVDDPSEELEVTLVWTDPPASPGANPAIVNDLDLELQGPDGTRYVGNAFTGSNPGYSEPDPDSNHWSGGRDAGFDGLNVEQTILLLPDQNGVDPGTYDVSVSAHNVAEGSQDFALVISGGVVPEETEPGPRRPTDPEPEDGATDVPIEPDLSVSVEHDEGASMDVSFHDASDDSVIGTDSGVASGSRASVTWSGLEQLTSYEWYAVAEEGGQEARSSTWSFNTEAVDPAPLPPSDPQPEDGATEVDTDTELSVHVEHEEGTNMDVSFHDASDDSVIGTHDDVTSGERAEVDLVGLEESTTYSWYAVADDGELAAQSDTWSFTTIAEPEAYFEVEIIDHDAEVGEGDDVTVQYAVTNTGDVEDTQQIGFAVDGNPEDSEQVELQPGDAHEGEFVWTAGEQGTYSLAVASEDTVDEVTVEVFEPAFFEVDITSYDDEVVEGETVVVDYTITNTGGAPDAQSVEFTVNGALEDSVDVTLDPGETHDDEFAWQTGSGGTYELSVASEDDSYEVMVQVLEEAYFEVEIEGYDEEVEKGEDLVVEYVVTNTGDLEETQDVEFLVDDGQVDSEEVTLDGGDGYQGEFVWTTDESGEFDLSVLSEDDSHEVTVTVLEPAFFEVEVGIPDEDAVQGEPLIVDYSVTNAGDVEETQEIKFEVYDEGDLIFDDSEEVTLGGISLATEDVYNSEFIWTPEEPGEYEVVVSSDDHEESFELTVLRAAYFEVSIISPGDGEEFDKGEEITIGFEVTNTGDVQGTYSVELYVDGEYVDTIEGSLDAGDVYQGEFTWEAEEDGDFEFNLRCGESDEFIQVSVEDAFPWWILLILLMVIVIILVVVLVMRRGDEEEEEDIPTQGPPASGPGAMGTGAAGAAGTTASEDEESDTCPTCGSELRHIEEYDRKYCDECQDYQ